MISENKLQKYKEIAPVSEIKGVWLVENAEDHRLYIKKQLHHFDAEVLEFFQKEEFPHIPKVHELIIDGEEAIVIEEHINGRTLEDLLAEGVFSEKETREIVLQLCSILKPLHDHDPAIIHRDIKPSNLILKDGVLYLIDFDIAKDYEPGKGRDTELMGTAGFAAPEQYGFSQSTPKTDIYSMGVLTNKMLTGYLPSETMYEGELASVIRKCTAIEPSMRYASVDDVQKALTGKKTNFAPPGFRSGNVLYGILAIIWYLFCFYVVVSLNSDENGNPYEGLVLMANKTGLACVLIGLTVYLSNYMGARDLFPFKKTGSFVVEIIRMALGVVLLIMVPATIIVIIEQLV